MNILPGLFISHGSPMLAIEAGQVGPALERIRLNLPKPAAIVVLSAHWEDDVLEVSTAVRPQTWHDFRGFPEELYKIHIEPLVSLHLQRKSLHYCNMRAWMHMPMPCAHVITGCGCHCCICIQKPIFP